MIPVADLHNDLMLIIDELESGYFTPQEIDSFINLSQQHLWSRLIDFEVGDLNALEKRMGLDNPEKRAMYLSPFFRIFDTNTVVDARANTFSTILNTKLIVDNRPLVKVESFAIEYNGCNTYSKARFQPSAVVHALAGYSLLEPSVMSPAWHYTQDGIKFYPEDQPEVLPAPFPNISAVGYVFPLDVDSVGPPVVDSEMHETMKELLVYDTVKRLGTHLRDPMLIDIARRKLHEA